VSARDLIARRVPQVLAVYLGACWGLVQFVDFLESRYALSPLWTDVTLLGLALLIPSVFLFTYNHGRPGRDRWTRSEMFGIPLNLVIAAVLLVLIFRDRDLGAVVTPVITTDESGQTVERVVPRASYRRRLALFNFDGAADDTAVAWLRYALPIALQVDLLQDIFIDVRPAPYFRDRLRQLGNQESVDVPLALKRSIAEEQHLPFFTDARISRSGEELTVNFALHEVTRAQAVQQRSYTGSDVFELVDRISADVRRDLGTPTSAETRDLPVSEVLTSSLPAFRLYNDGLITIQNRAQWPEGIAQLQRAVEIDPTFAAAWLSLHNVLLVSGSQDATAPLQKAMDHVYRLPERFQFDLKTEYYLIRQDHEKALATARMKVDLYPDDIGGYTLLSVIQQMRNDRDGVIATYEKILELDPSQMERLREIGSLYEQKGDYSTALRYYSQYAERFPEKYEAFLAMGTVYRLQGQLDQADSSFEKALLLSDQNVTVMVSLASLQRDRGRFEEATRQFEEALAAARIPDDRARVLAALASYHEFRGQPKRALEYTRDALQEAAKVQPPALTAAVHLRSLDSYVRAGREAEARTILARLSAQLQPPLTVFAPFGAMEIALAAEKPDEAERAITELEQVLQTTGTRNLEPSLILGRGQLAELRGNCELAVTDYEKYQALSPTDPIAHTYIGRCLRKMGQAQNSLAVFQRTLAVQPFQPLANSEIALAFLEMGDTPKAMEHLERAVSVWREAEPGHKSALAARSKLRELQATR
jgi:tetratricopeptide (TPR) repeat protein